jgi:O-antigen/teichoic acid export membrane protein
MKWTAVASGFGIFVQTVQTIVAARLLEPADVGAYALCLVLLLFVDAVADFGLSAYVIHRQDLTDRQLGALQTAHVVLGWSLGIGVILVAPLVGRVLESDLAGRLLALCAVSYFVNPFGGRVEWGLRRDLRFNVISRVQLIAGSAGLVGFLVLALFGVGVMALAAGYLVRACFAAVQYAWIGRGCTHFVSPREFPWRVALSHFGLPQIGERIMNTLSTRLDQIVIGPMAGLEALGYYSLAKNLLSLPMEWVNSVVTQVALPMLARIQESQKVRAGVYVRLTGALMMINAPYAVGFAVLASAAVPMIFGAEWLPAVPLVQPLAVVGLSRAIGNPVGCLLLSAGAARRGFVWNAACLAMSTVVIWVGALFGGVLGVALALSVMSVALQIPSYCFLVRPFTGPIGGSYSRAIGVPLVASILAALFALPLGWLAVPGVAILVLQIAVFVPAFVLAMGRLQPGVWKDVAVLLGLRKTAPAVVG